jgi:PKD repeat protein
VTLRTFCRWPAIVVLSAAAAACEKLPPAPELPDVLPTASFYFTPVAPIYAGQTAVDFSAIGSRDTDGQIVSYIWNFGDGTTPETSETPYARHTFPDTAARCVLITYGVSLIVVDNKGGSGVASANVTVTELPPPTSVDCQVPR